MSTRKKNDPGIRLTLANTSKSRLDDPNRTDPGVEVRNVENMM
jgi:hypothetical protein